MQNFKNRIVGIELAARQVKSWPSVIMHPMRFDVYCFVTVVS